MDPNKGTEIRAIRFFETLGKVTAGLTIILGLGWALIKPRCN